MHLLVLSILTLVGLTLTIAFEPSRPQGRLRGLRRRQDSNDGSINDNEFGQPGGFQMTPSSTVRHHYYHYALPTSTAGSYTDSKRPAYPGSTPQAVSNVMGDFGSADDAKTGQSETATTSNDTGGANDGSGEPPAIQHCGGQPFYPDRYTCYGDKLCPVVNGERTKSCGNDCYLESMYGCQNDRLYQIGQSDSRGGSLDAGVYSDIPTPTSTTTASSPGSSPDYSPLTNLKKSRLAKRWNYPSAPK